MKAGRLATRNKASSALVITLLCVVLLTIIVVAFMQTMSLSLTTSKSYVDIRRATLAAQAGLDTAIAQISVAAGTNLAFVTGLTNCTTLNGLTNFPVTLIGAGNLTNLDQVMPLVSGNIGRLTNFGVAGFATNGLSPYLATLFTNSSTYVVDVNTPYQFIQVTSGANAYLGAWVTMTNVVGSQVSYTRYAYVVLDDTARVNPALMTGAGTGFTNSTNWYTGPQDVNVTSVTNITGGQLLSVSQLEQITNSLASSNSYGYSDATLGNTYSSRAAYETNKIFLTSRMNPTFDVIPAWYTNGGMPKYNINDLATNTAYGTTPLARALNIASIITNNLPNFYLRDPALSTVGTNNTPGTVDQTLYAERLAANIVDYINPDGVWPATDYSTNMTGISPQGHGVYPVIITEISHVVAGAGSSSVASTSSTIVNQFWLSAWNPYTTPVTINSAAIHIFNRAGYSLNGGSTNAIPDYTNSVSVISGANGTHGPPFVVNPNEFMVLGFIPQTNVITGNSTTNGPTTAPNPATPLEQYSLTVNGQTTAQSGAMNPGRTTVNISGGLDQETETLSTNNSWESDAIDVWGNEVGDPRFESYYNDVWSVTLGGTNNSTSFWKGVDNDGGFEEWGGYVFPLPLENTAGYPVSSWGNRDNIARSPILAGTLATNNQITPDEMADKYNQATDSNAAPEVIRNGPMVSIGELGHVDDPAYANDVLSSVPPRTDGGGFSNAYTCGGARSLRIGRPEATGATTNSYVQMGWNVNGERAISLLDLFTVNNTNTSSAGATNSAMIATNMNYGGALGRINPNTASTNVLAALLSAVQVTSDPGMTNSSGQSISPAVLTNVPAMITNIIANRPYSSLSDLYKVMPMFDANTNYYPNLPMTTALNNYFWNQGSTTNSFYPSTLNVFNRVHQEAFGKLVQHLTVQSRSYRVYVIGQVLDSSQNPHGSVAMEAGIYLQYNPAEAKYNPVIQYLHVLK